MPSPTPAITVTALYLSGRTCTEITVILTVQWGMFVEGVPTAEWVCEKVGELEERFGRRKK